MAESGNSTTAEQIRLEQDASRSMNWKRWGPYLSERQWGTVREDYSSNGDCWNYLSHDDARSRAYRWGEDGLLGFCDRECRLCFSVALWNGQDPILKERLFGLTGPQGNHGEDVKELYYYLDSTPTHSYCKALYKYPQAAFPYQKLLDENQRRSRQEREFELVDTDVFAQDRYFDVFAEYAKASPDDLLIRLTVVNRGPDVAPLRLLPTFFFRNTWTWGCTHDGCFQRPRLWQQDAGSVLSHHETLGQFRIDVEPLPGERPPRLIFTENDTNEERLFKTPNLTPHVKDAFNDYVVHQHDEAVNPKNIGTKVAADFAVDVPAGGQTIVRLRLRRTTESSEPAFGPGFDEIFASRISEADAFYNSKIDPTVTDDQRMVIRQAYAGLLWSRQFYHYVVSDWLKGDPGQPPPPAGHASGRNVDWRHLFARDVLSVPDKWEYPWFAAWDLSFHMVVMARVDSDFAKEQLLLILREWYTHPNGQLPAYEFQFGDVNPPVHAWACWRVYKIAAPRGQRDTMFLKRAFQKLLMNFTWWVNRKDLLGKNLFAGGFLGLDNIGLFDRSQPLPTGGTLEQADGTAWMASYCGTMLSMALELAQEDASYEDIASKFFEHFVAIIDAINGLGGTGLWDEEDGFYCDQILVDARRVPLKLRSIVGLIPMFACEVIESEQIENLPGFKKRMLWFLSHRPDLARHISHGETNDGQHAHTHYLLAIPSRDRLERLLRYILDEKEFLAPCGVRSLSRIYNDNPYVFDGGTEKYMVRYAPAESQTALFGGNSNWRGPVWFPLNFLLLEALERYHHFYGDQFTVECPVGSGNRKTLLGVAEFLSVRLQWPFLADAAGRRPQNLLYPLFDSPHFKDLVLFYEYYDGDNGRGVGASHQTGWTSLVASVIRRLNWARQTADQRAEPKTST